MLLQFQHPVYWDCEIQICALADFPCHQPNQSPLRIKHTPLDEPQNFRPPALSFPKTCLLQYPAHCVQLFRLFLRPSRAVRMSKHHRLLVCLPPFCGKILAGNP